jgi:hypothetical protein
MLEAAVDVPDHFVRVDFTSRCAVQIGNGGIRHLQAFKLLLCDSMRNGPHIAQDVPFGRRGHVARLLFFKRTPKDTRKPPLRRFSATM